MNKLFIEEDDLEVFYQDVGPWRSYSLSTSGISISELVENGWIFEIDQDGGELDSYALEDAPNDVIKAAIDCINLEFNKWSNNK